MLRARPSFSDRRKNRIYDDESDHDDETRTRRRRETTTTTMDDDDKDDETTTSTTTTIRRTTTTNEDDDNDRRPFLADLTRFCVCIVYRMQFCEKRDFGRLRSCSYSRKRCKTSFTNVNLR